MNSNPTTNSFPAPAKTGYRLVTLVLFTGGAFLIGLVIASAAIASSMRASGTVPASQAEPEVVVETETVTEEVKVETTPQACVDALDSSDSLMRMFGEALTISGDAMMDAVNMDWTALDEKTAQLELLTPKVEDERAAYDKASIECRASVEG